MKIAILSDLHIDMNARFVGEELLADLINIVRTKELDILIIAGDLTDHVSTALPIIDELEQSLNIPIYFIPGNHDMWIKQDESSWDSYRAFANHPSSLINKSVVVNEKYVIVGDMGWFDYSLAADGIKKEQIRLAREDWGDYKYTSWKMEDAELLDYMLQQLERQLIKYKDKQVIFVTHFVPYANYLISSNEYMDWDVFNAFMGSSRMGELIDQFDSIEYVIFGHTHERYLPKKVGNKTIICSPLGYIAEPTRDCFQAELEKAITIIEI